MITLLTSCGRHDLLKETLETFYLEQKYGGELFLNIHEDSTLGFHYNSKGWNGISYTNGIGQHASIQKFMGESPNDKYYLHLEDDWKFENTYDWIQTSIEIMEADPNIIKVLSRKSMVHPVHYNCGLMSQREQIKIRKRGVNESDTFSPIKFGYLEPWTDPWKEILWHGFSWNPGVTRLDLLKRFVPFKKTEQEVAEDIFKAGYKVVALEQGVYSHIGEGRSTHE